jgi:hypothetical protein
MATAKDTTKVRRAIEFIRKHGSARTPEIAEHLSVHVHRVSAILWHAVKTGKLVSCEVQRPGQTPINEYRIGAGQPQVGMTPMRTYRQRIDADAKRRMNETKSGVHETKPPVPETTAAKSDAISLTGVDDARNKAAARAFVLARTETACGTMVPGAATVSLTAADLPRWALTSDGTFLELGTPHPIEIEPLSARRLIDFIRRLDGGEV